MKVYGKEVFVERGMKMKTGKGWRLVTPKGGNRGFKASLLQTFSSKGERFAIFRVLGYPEGE
jgi:hypothetical protein